MKKIILCVVLITLLFAQTPQQLNNLLDDEGAYSFYIEDKVVSIDNCCLTDLGSGQIVSCNKQYKDDVAAILKGVRGVSFVKNAQANSVEQYVLKLQIKVLFTERVGDIICIYGYSGRLVGGVDIDGKKINIQLAYNDGRLTIGSPLILGSY